MTATFRQQVWICHSLTNFLLTRTDEPLHFSSLTENWNIVTFPLQLPGGREMLLWGSSLSFYKLFVTEKVILSHSFFRKCVGAGNPFTHLQQTHPILFLNIWNSSLHTSYLVCLFKIFWHFPHPFCASTCEISTLLMIYTVPLAW